jgi:hypothetical protein
MTVIYGPEDALYGVARFGVARYGSVGPTKQVTGVSGSLSLGSIQVNLTLKPVGYDLALTLGEVDLDAKANQVIVGYSLTSQLGTAVTSAEANSQVTGFDLSVALGNTTFSADAFKALLGYNLNTSLGELTVRSINRVEVSGVSASFDLGLLTVEGGTGFTVLPDSLSAEITLGTIKPNLTTFVSGVSATVLLNSLVTLEAKAVKLVEGNNLDVDLGDLATDTVIFDYTQFAEDYSAKRTAYIPKVA